MAVEPTHLLWTAGDKVTMCGIRHRSPQFYPHLLARYVGRHKRGREQAGMEQMVICPVCEQACIEQNVSMDDPHEPRW